MSDKVFRVGAIGTGSIFNYAHLPAYAYLDGARLVAILDPTPGAAERTQEHYLALLKEAAQAQGRPAPESAEVRLCLSAEELLGQVDVVDICTPVRHHAYYAALALEHNVHAMSEKPMARTWWEARQVAEVAKRSKALFQLNDDNLFIPRYQALRNVIESGLIGTVQHLWIVRGARSSGRRPWFWKPLEAGGGAVLDYGSHAATSTWFLMGYDKTPAEVRSLGITVKERTRLVDGRLQAIEIDDDAHFKVRFVDPVSGDWASAVIEATWALPDLAEHGSDVHGYIEVEGSLGTATGYVDEQEHDFIRIRSRTFGERLMPVQSVTQERESFQGEILNFVRCISAGVPSLVNAEVGAGVMGILNAAQLSELRGRVAITPDELAAFSRETAGDAPDPWQGGDRIALALNQPYRLP
jgi:predicted dehydrogenase